MFRLVGTVNDSVKVKKRSCFSVNLEKTNGCYFMHHVNIDFYSTIFRNKVGKSCFSCRILILIFQII